MTDGIVISDAAGQVVLINRSAARILRADPQAGRGDPVYALFESCSPHFHTEMMDAMERLHADPDAHGQSEIAIKVGDRVVEAHLLPLLTEAGQFLGVVTLLHDVTHEVEAGQAGPGAAISDEAKQTVLVVEDDSDVAQLITLQLRQEGFDVLTTGRGKEALQLAYTQPIDLITLDVMLPDIAGMEVLRRLKTDQETADIPVIVVSVLQPDGSDIEWGAVEHITKPFALEKLVKSIRRTLEPPNPD